MIWVTQRQVFNLEIGYKWQKQKYAQKILTSVQSAILTTQYYLIAHQKLLISMGFEPVTRWESGITDWQNLFELVWTSLCSVVRNFWLIKDVVKQYYIFWFPTQLTSNSILQTIPTHKPFKLCNNYQGGCRIDFVQKLRFSQKCMMFLHCVHVGPVLQLS